VYLLNPTAPCIPCVRFIVLSRAKRCLSNALEKVKYKYTLLKSVLRITPNYTILYTILILYAFYCKQLQLYFLNTGFKFARRKKTSLGKRSLTSPMFQTLVYKNRTVFHGAISVWMSSGTHIMCSI